MPLRESERVEVVPGGLDLAAVDDLVTEAEEDVLDVAADLGRRMKRSPAAEPQRPEQLCWQRYVGALRRQLRLELRALQLVLPRRERLLDRLAGRIQGDTGLAVAHLAQRELQLRAATEVADARLVELGGRRRGLDRGQRLALERLWVHLTATVPI